MYRSHVITHKDVQHVLRDGLCHQFRAALCLQPVQAVFFAYCFRIFHSGCFYTPGNIAPGAGCYSCSFLWYDLQSLWLVMNDLLMSMSIAEQYWSRHAHRAQVLQFLVILDNISDFRIAADVAGRDVKCCPHDGHHSIILRRAVACFLMPCLACLAQHVKRDFGLDVEHYFAMSCRPLATLCILRAIVIPGYFLAFVAHDYKFTHAVSA